MEFLNKLDVNNSKVTEVATPTLGTDAANKSYVDTALALKAPLASPTFTGTVTGNFTETKQDLGTIATATTINCASGSIVTATLGAAISIGITAGASASTCRVCTLLLTNGGAYTITWNSAIKWAGGTAPTLTASGVDILTFMTVDNGTIWRGALNGADFK